MALRITSLWPKSTGSAQRMSRIEQIVYSISENGENDGMIDIMAQNVYAPKDKPYLWCKVPASYKEHLARAFLRLKLFFNALKSNDLEPASSTLLKKNILYLDKILDQVWDDAKSAESSQSMSMDWRSVTLDEWMVVECVVGRHDPDTVNALKTKEDLRQDACDLGEHTYFIFIIFNYLL